MRWPGCGSEVERAEGEEGIVRRNRGLGGARQWDGEAV